MDLLVDSKARQSALATVRSESNVQPVLVLGRRSTGRLKIMLELFHKRFPLGSGDTATSLE